MQIEGRIVKRAWTLCWDAAYLLFKKRWVKRQIKNVVFIFDFSEPHPILFKDRTRWVKRQIKNVVFIFDFSEPHPILFKDRTRRVKRQIKNVVFIFDFSEPHPILFKDSERREQYKMKKHFFSFLLPSRSLSYLKIVKDNANRRQNRQACLNVMLRCSLSSF